MSLICGKGINDMPCGWASKNELNKRVYQVWHRMLYRCYDEKLHEKKPTYINCTVCNRWLYLSNFVEDIVKIPNYNLWLSGFNEKINPYQLDKDIKSNGTNKCYCLEQCQFVSHEENSRQAHKGKHKGKHKIERYDLNMNLIDIKYQFEYVEMGFNAGHISDCCRGRRKTHKGYIFIYHKKDD